MRTRVFWVLFIHVFGAVLMFGCGADVPAEGDGDEPTGEVQEAIYGCTGCTKVCNGITTKACGGACIPKAYTCHTPPGDACNKAIVQEDAEPGGTYSVPDSFIRSSAPNTNFGSADSLQLGPLVGGEEELALIRFDAPFAPQGDGPYLPQGAIVKSATVQLTAPQWASGVEVHAIMGEWEENTVNWNNFTGYEGQPLVVAAGPTFNLPIDRVQCWIDGIDPACANNGIVLKAPQHSQIRSGEYLSNGQPADRPTLTVCYTDCGGSCDDGNPCTEDTCTVAGCVHTPVPNGTSCGDDGNACTTDQCVNGACAHAPTVQDVHVLWPCNHYPVGNNCDNRETAECKKHHGSGVCSKSRLDAWCERNCEPYSNCAHPDAWDNAKRDAVQAHCQGGAVQCKTNTDPHNGHKSTVYWCDMTCKHYHADNTPLVLVFDPVRPVTFEAPSVCHPFDLAGDGSGTRLDWPTAATPWLALDRDGNGTIDSGEELFGSATPLGLGTAANGFEALAALDENGDGVIDAADPAFGAIRVWADQDGSRSSSPAELRSLADLGIVELSLRYHVERRCDERGNCEIERARFVWIDGAGKWREGALVDVHLASPQGG